MGVCGDEQIHPKGKAIAGPVKRRSVTDVFYIPLYLAFVGFLVYVLIRACKEGDIYRLLSGHDSYGNICGRKNEPIQGVASSGIDMTKLPKVFLEFVKLNGTNVALFTKQLTCIDKCSENHTVLFNRCISGSIPGRGVFSGLLAAGSDFIQDLGEDLEKCWEVVIYLTLIAFAFSIVIIVLLRFASGAFIWFSLLSVVVCSISGTVYMWLLYKRRKDLLDELGDTSPTYFQRRVKIWLIAAIVFTVITVLICLVILIMRKRIALVIALFQEAGKAVIAMPLMLFLPLLTFVFVCLLLAGWMVGSIYIMSVRDPHVNSDGTVRFVIQTFFKRIRLYHFFLMLWTVQFVVACQHIVVAGAVSRWYFTKVKTNLKTPIASSILTLIRYHIGSVLFGSLIIAFVKFLRFLIKRLHNSISKSNLSGCLKLASCCMWIFEKILAFLNRSAYIEIVIYGGNFCSSAKRAFKVITNNMLSVFAINSVGDFVLFLCRVGITMATFFIGLEFVKDKEMVLNYTWFPPLVGSVFAFIVSGCFLAVYEMTIDTIFICFCEDSEQNDGTAAKPYYMSIDLMEFIENCKKEMIITQETNKEVTTAAAATNRKTQPRKSVLNIVDT